MWESALLAAAITVGSLSPLGSHLRGEASSTAQACVKRKRRAANARGPAACSSSQVKAGSSVTGMGPEDVALTACLTPCGLSQLKPSSSRTLGRPLPATLLSPNRKAGGTGGQDLRARESEEQRKGSYSLRGDYFGRCWPGHRQH